MKFYKECLFLLKKQQNCYGYFDKRIIEGIVYQLNFKFCIDVGFKSLLDFYDLKCNKHTIFVNFFRLDSIFNEVLINCMFSNKVVKLSRVWFFLKKSYRNKFYIKGRFLNIIQNGYSIGVCGIVGFLPKKQLGLLQSKIMLNYSIFHIKRIDSSKKIFTLSQKNIIKQSSRILFKLSLNIIKNKNIHILGKYI